MPETNNQNPTSTPPSTDTKQIFFNVPGKNRMQGPRTSSTAGIMHAPNVAVEEEPTNRIKLFFRNALKQNKPLLYVALGAVVFFAIAGYLVFHFIIEKPSNDSSTLNLPQQSPSMNTTTPKSEMSDSWKTKYFANCTDTAICGDSADPDRDGLKNVEEFRTNTDPNNADSDTDGIADGDEVNIFLTDPTNQHTSGNQKYTDTDDIKNGYDPKNPGKKFADDRLADIKTKLKQLGVHQPTMTTLGEVLMTSYGMADPAAGADTGTATTGQDTSPEAVLDRDTERKATIQKIGIALVKYKKDIGIYPITDSFTEMATKVKPYNLVATTAQDPINKDPFVYIYLPSKDGKTFALTYYSESQKLPIRYTSEQAEKDFSTEDATLRDEQRMQDLESIRSALLTYSSTKISGNQTFVFPATAKYKTELSPALLTAIPKDPKTAKDYEYQVSTKFDSFTLKAILENPGTGMTGYLCNQEECKKY